MEIRRCTPDSVGTCHAERLREEKNERGPRHRATAYSYKYIMVPRLKLDFERARGRYRSDTL